VSAKLTEGVQRRKETETSEYVEPSQTPIGPSGHFPRKRGKDSQAAGAEQAPSWSDGFLR